jgi:hypothetical protein
LAKEIFFNSLDLSAAIGLFGGSYNRPLNGAKPLYRHKHTMLPKAFIANGHYN